MIQDLSSIISNDSFVYFGMLMTIETLVTNNTNGDVTFAASLQRRQHQQKCQQAT